jgi:hypothetical protein
MKVKTKGTQLFNIPNNEEGEIFLSLCKEYINKKRYKFSKRGRASHRPKFAECGYNSAPSLRVKDSEWFAVYPIFKKTEEERKRDYERSSQSFQKLINEGRKIMELEAKVTELQLKLAKTQAQLSDSQTMPPSSLNVLRDVKVVIGKQVYELAE